MRILFVSALLVLGCAHADVILKNGNTTIGPVLAIDCAADGGLVCRRDAGTSIGSLACAVANATTIGCVIPGPQTFTGTKNIDGGLVVNGNALVDGGFAVNGPTQLDGGVYIQGVLTADGGVYSRRPGQFSQVTATNGSFLGNAPADGGLQQYLNFNDIITGRRQAIMPTSPSLSLQDGVSLPQSSQLCGFFPGGIRSGAFEIAGNRMASSGQFLRLSTSPLVTGYGDGGLAADGGAIQSWYAAIVNVTTGQVLCQSSNNACNASVNFTGSNACAADAGALFTIADDVDLRVYTQDCLGVPVFNVCAEYVGSPP